MTAFQEEGFNKTNLKILNHCRLALQVTTLMEITDHTRLQLIQEALLNGPTLPSLLEVSKSKNVWPQQPTPGKFTWTLWTKVLQTTFTKLGLKQPLGSWTPNANSNHTWHATFNPTMQEIYQHLPSQPPQAYSIHRTMRSHHFYHTTQPTAQSPTIP